MQSKSVAKRLKVQAMTENSPGPGTCAFCQQPSQGNYSVHRDGFCEGPEVDLCDECGGNLETPTLEEIWARITTTPRTSVGYAVKPLRPLAEDKE